MRTFLFASVLAMGSAGIYGAFDMSNDIMSGKMITYDKGGEFGDLSEEDFSRAEPNYVPEKESEAVKKEPENIPDKSIKIAKYKKKKTIPARPKISAIKFEDFSRGEIEVRLDMDTELVAVVEDEPDSGK